MDDLETLFRKHRNDVYRLALSYTRSVQEAEDVCQGVFLKLMECPAEPGKERAWLMQVTVNQCRNLLRSAWWRNTAALDESISVPAYEYNDVYRAVMELKPKYRVVVFLRYYEELTTKEIARLLHITPTAVTTRIARARDMLRDTLKEEVI